MKLAKKHLTDGQEYRIRVLSESDTPSRVAMWSSRANMFVTKGDSKPLVTYETLDIVDPVNIDKVLKCELRDGDIYDIEYRHKSFQGIWTVDKDAFEGERDMWYRYEICDKITKVEGLFIPKPRDDSGNTLIRHKMGELKPGIKDEHLTETFGPISPEPEPIHKPKILILGHGQHGKDTVAAAIKHLTGLAFSSSSLAALDAIKPVLKAATGKNSVTDLYENRSNNRALWKEAISLYNTPDKTALCRKILDENDMYVGMRCDLEFEECECLFDHIFWVDASERKPLEDTMLIKFDKDIMIPICNNGPEWMLGLEVLKALEVAGIKWINY